MKIMLTAFGQETNTFSPDRLELEDFCPMVGLKEKSLWSAFERPKAIWAVLFGPARKTVWR